MDLIDGRGALLAQEIGHAVIALIAKGRDVNQEDIEAYLESRRKRAGGVHEKKLLKDAIEIVRAKNTVT